MMIEDEAQAARRAFEQEGERVRMQHINRIGRRALICMAALLLIAILYGLFG